MVTFQILPFFQENPNISQEHTPGIPNPHFSDSKRVEQQLSKMFETTNLSGAKSYRRDDKRHLQRMEVLLHRSVVVRSELKYSPCKWLEDVRSFSRHFFSGAFWSVVGKQLHIAQSDPSLLRTCLWLVQFLPRIGAASMRWKVVVMPFARILKSFAYGPRKRRPPLFCFKLWGLTARPGKHFGGVSHDCKGEKQGHFFGRTDDLMRWIALWICTSLTISRVTVTVYFGAWSAKS